MGEFLGVIGVLAIIGSIVALIIRLIIYFAKHKEIDKRDFNKKTFYVIGIFIIGFIFAISGSVMSTEKSVSKVKIHHTAISSAASKKEAKPIMSAAEKKKLSIDFQDDAEGLIGQFKVVTNNLNNYGSNITSADAEKIQNSYQYIVMTKDSNEYKLNKYTKSFYDDITDAAWQRGHAAAIMEKALENNQDLSDKMQPYIDTSNDDYQKAQTDYKNFMANK
jgi:hypothetical protein